MQGIVNLIETFLESVLDSLVFREVLLAISGSIGSLEQQMISLHLNTWVKCS
jgi:hypothetical protein